ncbi:hypothetical protein ANCCEY_12449 [Ancylostoma ceylanicum]|uniref:SLC41A/MgtE integral membrane domain-containing protein n=1 Tax=Ancylostoma ceylanicum TaxID=53326 RepID=A0A0D6L994_9BILA|nr:hypothetical protein ANCCEY_12449 [Ancylostoma ceylanicum]
MIIGAQCTLSNFSPASLFPFLPGIDFFNVFGISVHSSDDFLVRKLLPTRETLIPFVIAGLGSICAGLLLNRVQKLPLVPQFIAICPPLQGMKGNLDMTFTSRLSTEAQAVAICLFAALVTFALDILAKKPNEEVPVMNFLFLGSSALFAMCLACMISSLDHDERAWIAARQQGPTFLLASILSSGAGIIQAHGLKSFPELTVYQPLITGVAGNRASLQSARISSYVNTYKGADKLAPRLNPWTYYTSPVYVAQIVVYCLYHFRIDPDMHAIPLVTAIGDLVGTALLLSLFYVMSYGDE